MDAATGMDSDPTQTVFVACQLNYDSLSFRFEGIVWSDFHDGSVGIPAFVREGQNVHIKATVDKYNPDSGFPASWTAKNPPVCLFHFTRLLADMWNTSLETRRTM